VSCPGCTLPPGKTRYPLYRRLGGRQGRSGLVRKISPPPGFDPRTIQPVGSHYTDWATRPTDHTNHRQFCGWLQPSLQILCNILFIGQSQLTRAGNTNHVAYKKPHKAAQYKIQYQFSINVCCGEWGNKHLMNGVLQECSGTEVLLYLESLHLAAQWMWLQHVWAHQRFSRGDTEYVNMHYERRWKMDSKRWTGCVAHLLIHCTRFLSVKLHEIKTSVILLLLQSALQPLCVLACSTIVECSQQEGFYRVPLPAACQTPNFEDQWLERSNSRHQASPMSETTWANPSSGRWNYGREMAENFAESGDFHVTFGFFYMP